MLMIVTIFYVPLVLPLILIPTARILGGRNEPTTPAAAPDATPPS
jgi:hypothetical protein